MTTITDFLDVIDYTSQFVKINSFTTEGKHEIIHLVHHILREKTNATIDIYDTQTDDPYLVASLTCPNPTKKLLLQGHLDVVDPLDMKNPFDAIIKDDVMYGRGTADMKAGCAAILSTFIHAAQHQLTADLYLVFTTDEEYSGEKIKKAFSTGHIPHVDFALIPEPTDCQIANTHKGEAYLEFEFYGKSAHSSVPHLGNNAIVMAANFISQTKKLSTAYQNITSDFGSPTLNVGTITGGKSPNIVPDYAKVVVDLRYLPGFDLQDHVAEFEALLQSLKLEDESFDAKLSVTGHWNALNTDANHELLNEIWASLSCSMNQEVAFTSWPAWGEGGYIQAFDIPTIYFGPGELKYPHTIREQIKISDVIKVTQAYCDLIKRLCMTI